MTPPPAAPRVVAAVRRDVQARIRAILPDCELRFVDSGTQLARALDEAHCDLLIVGTHFDESSAVAALERVLSREETFPVVCVRGVPSTRLGAPALNALRLALDELGAQDFIDLLQYPDDALGNARVRAMLERLLPS
jgi:DNA-binding NtrC family response regulator